MPLQQQYLPAGLHVPQHGQLRVESAGQQVGKDVLNEVGGVGVL
jgi:hypothetical protein